MSFKGFLIGLAALSALWLSAAMVASPAFADDGGKGEGVIDGGGAIPVAS